MTVHITHQIKSSFCFEPVRFSFLPLLDKTEGNVENFQEQNFTPHPELVVE